MSTAAYQREYYQENRERILARVKAWVATPAGKAKRRTVEARRRRRDSEKVRARRAVSNALRDGRISKRPCEVCGLTAVEAHHTDYSKPYEVRWLCKEHHNAEHH